MDEGSAEAPFPECGVSADEVTDDVIFELAAFNYPFHCRHYNILEYVSGSAAVTMCEPNDGELEVVALVKEFMWCPHVTYVGREVQEVDLGAGLVFLPSD